GVQPGRHGLGPRDRAEQERGRRRRGGGKGAEEGPGGDRTTAASSATSSAIERFGSKKISAKSGASTTMKGSRPYLNVRMRSPFFAASMAVQTTTANLASSEGCTVTKPRLTQRRAPLMLGAMRWVKGSNGMRSSTAATASTGQAHRCHRR